MRLLAGSTPGNSPSLISSSRKIASKPSELLGLAPWTKIGVACEIFVASHDLNPVRKNGFGNLSQAVSMKNATRPLSEGTGGGSGPILFRGEDKASAEQILLRHGRSGHRAIECKLGA